MKASPLSADIILVYAIQHRSRHRLIMIGWGRVGILIYCTEVDLGFGSCMYRGRRASARSGLGRLDGWNFFYGCMDLVRQFQKRSTRLKRDTPLIHLVWSVVGTYTVSVLHASPQSRHTYTYCVWHPLAAVSVLCHPLQHTSAARSTYDDYTWKATSVATQRFSPHLV